MRKVDWAAQVTAGRTVPRAAWEPAWARTAARADLAAPAELLPDLPPRWSGHSLRRGFATAAKQASKDLIETGRHGGWTDGSKSLAAYFDQAEIWDETNPLYGIGL